MLQSSLPWLAGLVAAKATRRLPVVLTGREVRDLLLQLHGTQWLVAALLYGTGMRVLEGLRVKDVDFERREIVVRQGKGGKDRVTVLPENLLLPLRKQLENARALHARDLAAGHGEVWLPDALALKYRGAGRAWGWQWVFPGSVRSVDPRSGIERRHHLHEQSAQRAVALAARRHSDVRKTQIYTHVLNKGPRAVLSPLDAM